MTARPLPVSPAVKRGTLRRARAAKVVSSVHGAASQEDALGRSAVLREDGPCAQPAPERLPVGALKTSESAGTVTVGVAPKPDRSIVIRIPPCWPAALIEM